MKLPVKCPYCGSIMITSFEGVYSTSKICALILDHWIRLSAYNADDNIFAIRIRVDNRKDILSHAYWNFNDKELNFDSTRGEQINLPWFDPDLSNYPKLCERVKLLVLLS